MLRNIFSKKGKKIEFLSFVILVLFGISLRIFPHPPNFTPILAISLFGGVYFSKKVAFILPIAIMVISDAFIGYYELRLMMAVYGSFFLSICLGFWLKKNKKWSTVLMSSVFVAIIFFLLTNLAVWVFTPWYAKTFSGIIQCYLMAIPFLKNTLFGSLFFVIVFFGTYEVIEIWVKLKNSVFKRRLV